MNENHRLRLTSFTQASTEIRRLRAFWAALQFSFEAARADIRSRFVENPAIGDRPLKLNSGEKISENHYTFQSRLKNQNPRYARELIFVRLISTVEVFLVDMIRDIFLKRPDLFHNQSRLFQITHAELLAAKDLSYLRNRLIAGELRQLHSKGLKEISRYYEKKLHVRFSSLGINLQILWEMVDRRHLLVHRLGRADESYRRRYNFYERRALTVSQDYLNDSFALVEHFVSGMEDGVASLISEPAGSAATGADNLRLQIEVESASAEADALLRPSFAFVVNDRLVGERTTRLDDILSSSSPNIDESGYILELTGTREEIAGYVKELKKRHRKGLLSYTEIGKINKGPALSKSGPRPADETIRAVAMRLPIEPWPQGIHKVIAAELGISNGVCSRAIDAIKNTPAIYELIGTSSDDGDGLQRALDGSVYLDPTPKPD